jgi:L-lactate dehydrogenase complex protein LldF
MSDTPALGSRTPLPLFQDSAPVHLANRQLRSNLAHATATIRRKRALVTSEVPEWEDLRRSAGAARDRALDELEGLLDLLEASVSAAGGIVHRADTGSEAIRVVTEVAQRHGFRNLVKVKSITTDEIGLNRALLEAGIAPLETDLAELIIQLAGEAPSHVLVPAIHKNRSEIRDLFREALGLPDLSDDPGELAEAARLHLRAAFLRAEMAVSGANFAVAPTGTVGVVESEGNGRMCLTLPRVLVTIMGIEKVLASWDDLGTILRVLPRSATGERMNPYTTLWSGTVPGDGPEEFHLVLLDNGRRRALADPVGRQALKCIRCSACMNSCPVYERTGGHAYSSPYPGPIGSILTPQLLGPGAADSLPFASTLCGACRDVCPVRIDIPDVLLHLRGRAVAEAPRGARSSSGSLDLLLRLVGAVMERPKLYRRAQRWAGRVSSLLGRDPWLPKAPGPLEPWTRYRDLPLPPRESFAGWWAREERSRSGIESPAASGNEDAGNRERPPEQEAPAAIEDPAGLGTEPAGSPVHSTPPRSRRPPPPEDLPSLLEERLSEYGAHVVRTSSGELAAALTRVLAEIRAELVTVPIDVRSDVRAGVEGWARDSGGRIEADRPDRPLSTELLDRCGAAVTECGLAMAETGTLVLTGDRGDGRRILSLLPDHHVCVLPASTIVWDVPEAIPALEARAQAGAGAMTLISGPSATSDIELERVEGVHGPRHLHVVLVRDA